MKKNFRTRTVNIIAKIDRNSRYYLFLKKFKKVIPNILLAKLNPYLMAALPDRRYMEETILPTLNALNPQRVLFVGVRGYTAHYWRLFWKGCEYWTMDIDPSVTIYGSNKHVTGDVLEVDQIFPQSFFDIVIMHGVFGYGINKKKGQNKAFEKIHKVLKPDGIMLLGWDTHRTNEPLELEGAKKYFSHTIVAFLPERKTFEDSAVVYDFFKSRVTSNYE